MKFHSTSVTLLVPFLWQGIQYGRLRLQSGQEAEPLTMGSKAEPWNQVIHRNCMKENYENYNKVNSLDSASSLDKKQHGFRGRALEPDNTQKLQIP